MRARPPKFSTESGAVMHLEARARSGGGRFPTVFASVATSEQVITILQHSRSLCNSVLKVTAGTLVK